MEIKNAGVLSQNTNLLYNVSNKKKINAIEYTKNPKIQFM
jgi:hypothetical protein